MADCTRSSYVAAAGRGDVHVTLVLRLLSTC